MNNYIYFYKIPFVYGGITQPYFVSDSARDNWLSKYSYKQINNVGVNIKLGFNYEIEIKANIDITEIENYNFALINYNGKNYYAYIIDSEHISVNHCRVLLIRTPLFEVTNYLSYFKNIKIEKATIRDYLSYGNGSRYMFKNNLRKRFIQKYVNFECNGESVVKFSKFAVFYFDPTVNFKLLDRPEVFSRLSLTVSNITSNCIYFMCPIEENVYARIDDTSNSYGEIINKVSISFIRNFLYDHSANLIKYEIISIPLISRNFDGKTYNNCLPFNCYAARLSDAENNYGILVDKFDLILTTYLPFKNLYSSLYIYFFEFANLIKLDAYKYNGQSRIEVTYIPSIDNSQLRVKVFTDDAQSEAGLLKEIYNVSMNNTVSYSVTAESTFNAENRYYDVLTNNAISQKGFSGIIQSVSSIGAGAAELRAPSALKTYMTAGSLALGEGNIVRGIAQLADTANDITFYEREREILANQSKMAPSVPNKCGNGAAFISNLDGEIIIYEEVPFDIDYETIIRDFSTYGVECYTEEDNFDFSLHLVDGYFFLKGIGVLAYPTSLTTRQYSEFYNILKNGVRYEYIE